MSIRLERRFGIGAKADPWTMPFSVTRIERQGITLGPEYVASVELPDDASRSAISDALRSLDRLVSEAESVCPGCFVALGVVHEPECSLEPG